MHDSIVIYVIRNVHHYQLIFPFPHFKCFSLNQCLQCILLDKFQFSFQNAFINSFDLFNSHKDLILYLINKWCGRKKEYL